MIVSTVRQEIQTRERDDCINITETMQQTVLRSKIREGLATVFVTGSTAGVTTIEYESGLVKDLQEAVRRLFPESLRYAHHEAAAKSLRFRHSAPTSMVGASGDDNGFSHLRASFIGPSLTVPVADAKLQLGTWQQIVLIPPPVLACRRQAISIVIYLIGLRPVTRWGDTHPRRRSYVIQLLGD